MKLPCLFLAAALAAPLAEPPLPPAPWQRLTADYFRRGLVVAESEYADKAGPAKGWTVAEHGVAYADVPIDGLTYSAYVYQSEGGTCHGVALSGWGQGAPIYPPPPDKARWSRLIRAFFGPGVLADYRGAKLLQSGPQGPKPGRKWWLRGQRFSYEVTVIFEGYQSFHLDTHAEGERSRRWANQHP